MNKKYSTQFRFMAFILLGIILLSTSTVLAASLDQKTLGDGDAPVTIEMFTDFQCPFCSRWHTQTFPLIEDNYIEEGKVKLVVKHFPLTSIHPQAQPAAIAAECAAEQGEFFDYIDLVYSNQDELEDNNLEGYAEKLRLDMDEFNECLEEDDTKEIIEDDMTEGTKWGVRGPPAFFVNDKLVSGAQPYSVFEQVIENALNNGNVDNTPKSENMQREPIRGDREAKVEIIGYMGYNDPFSKRAWDTINQLFREFDSDEINFEFRNYPLTFQDKEYLAAQAGECVLDLKSKDFFFEYSDELMINKHNDFQTVITEAIRLGVDRTEMNRCMNDNEFLPEVLDDLENGQDDGVTGTPTFFINDKKLSGAQPYSVFENIIKDMLDGDFDEEEIINEDESEDDEVTPILDEPHPTKGCLNGCEYDSNCIPYGVRLVGDVNEPLYCSINGELETQKGEGLVCQNNYECSTNQCSSGECVDLEKKLEETNSLVKRLLDLLGRLFGNR